MVLAAPVRVEIAPDPHSDAVALAVAFEDGANPEPFSGWKELEIVDPRPVVQQSAKRFRFDADVIGRKRIGRGG